MEKEIIISPICYMGNKRKLVKNGLVELFPKNINTMVELFGGSSIVSMNTKANRYFISDIDNNLVDLYKLFTGNGTGPFKWQDDKVVNYVDVITYMTQDYFESSEKGFILL